MPDSLFDQNLSNPAPVSNDEVVKEINEINEKEYLAKVSKKNSKNLIKLDLLERERIAQHIADLHSSEKANHKTKCDEMDKWDAVYRMERDEKSDDGDSPNYRTPLSTVTLEVIHANVMNVVFTPKDVLRVLPTEAGDIPKIKKLDIFGNWSIKNELEIFENCDRLFHSSGKNGECPYMVHWVKEYGTEIIIEPLMNPADPSEPLIDPDTKEVLTQEREAEKLLYNGPKLEIFSRKDYIIPSNSILNRKPDWELRIIRLSADKVNRKELEGSYYKGTFEEIGGWGQEGIDYQDEKVDKDGQPVKLSKTEKNFVEFRANLRIKMLAEDKEGDEAYKELEDDFIGIMELNSQTLCCLKKNKFPMKISPYGLDVFIPDDEGRTAGIGVMEFMDSLQTGYDALHNQYIFGTIQSNNPYGFFSPTGNQKDEPIKVKAGYLYPTADPSSVNFVKIPPPDQSLREMMELMRFWSQVLFGVSEYAMGIESSIDPTAPAKKAEIVVAQGNVRLNLIIKRKNQTLKDIFKKWFLLYQANMPPNKFMRVAGDSADTPYQFEKINLSDFSLNSIPDFELTGNILNSNKTLEIQKALSVYQVLLANPFFNPQTTQGLQSVHALTKWLIDKMDETGLSSFLPPVKGDSVHTPEEENARFLQGDTGEPTEQEDHLDHMRKHRVFLETPNLPDEVTKAIIEHIALHVKMFRELMTKQMVMQMSQPGGQSVPGQAGAPQAPPSLPMPAGMGGPQG